MSDIFREVDEAMQQDRAAELWKEYGSAIITAAVVMVLTTGLFSGFKSWQAANKEKHTAALMTAMEQDGTDALMNVAENSRKPQQSIAVFSAAGQHIANSEFAEALAIYEKAIEGGLMTGEFEDLARLNSVRLQMAINDENLSGQAMLDALAPVLRKSKSPWVHHAKVEAALVEGEYNGNFEKAAALTEEVMTTEAASADLKERAKAMQHVFELKAAKKAVNTDNNQEG